MCKFIMCLYLHSYYTINEKKMIHKQKTVAEIFYVGYCWIHIEKWQILITRTAVKINTINPHCAVTAVLLC